MLGTLGSALFLILISLAVGGAIVRLSGRREWSWVAAPVGLAAVTIIAWWAARLPGEGSAALIVLAIVALLSAAYLWARVERIGVAVRLGALPFAFAAVAICLPFLAEGHFGILGTGFNVDMSQHLFAADWLARPLAPEPSLVSQGYPMGPHALAVAASELTRADLALAFAGITVAVPVLLALSSLAAAESLSRLRAGLLALSVGVSYLIVTYVAQGSFKEVFAAAFLVGFVLWLREIGKGRAGEGPRVAIPLAVLAAGMLYVYSAPGLVWLVAALACWAFAELFTRARLRNALPAVLTGIALTLAIAAPELPRIAEFGGNVSDVADSSNRESGSEVAPAALFAAAGNSDADARPGGRSDKRGLEFNDDLGNLFGQISPLTALNVWPSGDFRVQPGDGEVPAAGFYLGSLVALLALGWGLYRWIREDELAIPAALAAAVIVFLAARAFSTPYTTAKALEMIAPLAMLISARAVLKPGAARPALLIGVAFLAGAGASTGLVLANVPIGPEIYNPGVAKLRPEVEGKAVLVLVPAGEIANRHAADYYSWELRGASEICLEPALAEKAPAAPVPGGIDLVLAPNRSSETPFVGLIELASSHSATLWAPKVVSATDDPGSLPESCGSGPEPTS